ncbi:rod shape-determining protein MreD [Candidatus Pelagibacter sp.]|jgi:rod shape-determining protein MreD|nr:rod shape-determining protein MreD [Candidatus Pelagibacter sp.]
MINAKKNIRYFLYKHTPVILLFTSILNEIDFNNLELKYFSFNFAYILIFYYNLKRDGGIGYIFIFIAGLFNDVINGIPMGISSLCYLLLCFFAAYLRNITLRPNLIKDWISFLVSILILNFITFTYLFWFNNYETDYLNQTINITFTFLLYFIFSHLFTIYDNAVIGRFK